MNRCLVQGETFILKAGPRPVKEPSQLARGKMEGFSQELLLRMLVQFLVQFADFLGRVGEPVRPFRLVEFHHGGLGLVPAILLDQGAGQADQAGRLQRPNPRHLLPLDDGFVPAP